MPWARVSCYRALGIQRTCCWMAPRQEIPPGRGARFWKTTAWETPSFHVLQIYALLRHPRRMPKRCQLLRFSQPQKSLCRSATSSRFKCIGEAYEVLTDPTKKELYEKGWSALKSDSWTLFAICKRHWGYDLEGINEQIELKKRWERIQKQEKTRNNFMLLEETLPSINFCHLSQPKIIKVFSSQSTNFCKQASTSHHKETDESWWILNMMRCVAFVCSMYVQIQIFVQRRTNGCCGGRHLVKHIGIST